MPFIVEATRSREAMSRILTTTWLFPGPECRLSRQTYELSPKLENFTPDYHNEVEGQVPPIQNLEC